MFIKRFWKSIRSLSSSISKVKSRKKLVILGSGWGSYSLLKNIDKALYDVIVVTPRNHFLFTPLLASTTVGMFCMILHFTGMLDMMSHLT